MAVKARELPRTMVSPQTGETLRRGIRPFVVSYRGRSRYPGDGDDGIHVGGDMAVTEAALRALKEEVEELRRQAG